MQFLPILLIMAVCYFLLLRPQMTKQKELRGRLEKLEKGDEVVTAGGIIGKVLRVVDKDEVLIDVADGVSLRVVRSTIAMVQKKDSKAA